MKTEDAMTTAIDATKLPPHGIFYLEDAGGLEQGREVADQPQSSSAEHAPSCFGFEEERGEPWGGAGSSSLAIKETRPSL